MQNPAITNDGRTLLVILNNKIIGKCLTRFTGDKKIVTVQYINFSTNKEITQLLRRVLQLQMSTERHLLVKFDSLTGQYINCDSRSSIADELDSAFKDIYLVDETRFYLGLSPSFFRNVPGFGKDYPLNTASVYDHLHL